MSINSGPIICTTTAAITHNQRVNKNNEEKVSSTNNRNKVMTNYETITSPKEILEELKFVIEQEINKEENSISMYDVINLVRKKYEEYKLLDYTLCRNISGLTDLDIIFLDVDFDYENSQLIIKYYKDNMYFTKQNNDLILVKSEYYDAKNILGKCGKEISERYDKFIEDISFYRDYMNNVQSTNSNFKINSDKYEININYNQFFTLSAKIFKNEYKYDCNSNNIISVYRGKEDELFQKIFIKIDDCPEWTHEILYELRKEQLQKQKRLELVIKLNPFRKK